MAQYRPQPVLGYFFIPNAVRFDAHYNPARIAFEIYVFRSGRRCGFAQPSRWSPMLRFRPAISKGLFLGVGLISAAIGAYGTNLIQQAEATRDWPTVQGKIVASDIRPGVDETTARPLVRFEYTLRGTIYRSEQFRQDTAGMAIKKSRGGSIGQEIPGGGQGASTLRPGQSLHRSSRTGRPHAGLRNLFGRRGAIGRRRDRDDLVAKVGSEKEMTNFEFRVSDFVIPSPPIAPPGRRSPTGCRAEPALRQSCRRARRTAWSPFSWLPSKPAFVPEPPCRPHARPR